MNSNLSFTLELKLYRNQIWWAHNMHHKLQTNYRHSWIYAVNVGTHKKETRKAKTMQIEVT